MLGEYHRRFDESRDEGDSSSSAKVESYVERHDIPELPQRQDSTQAQLQDLRAVAERLGMYDAADLLRAHEDQRST